MSRGLTARRLIGATVVLLLATAPLAAQEPLERSRERPAALLPLYVGFAGLLAVDVHSTLSAVEAGARERNPVIRGVLGNPAGMVVLKGATAAGVILLSEKLWPHNRTAPVITMVALNSAYAMVAAHNYRTQGRAR